jgi:hypothetical protein
MRVTAGILMIVSGIILIVESTYLVTKFGFSASLGPFPLWISPTIFTLALVAAVFVIIGGIFAFLKKFWLLCLASSIIATIFLPTMMIIYLVIGVLAIIFVCLAKKEWQG